MWSSAGPDAVVSAVSPGPDSAPTPVFSPWQGLFLSSSVSAVVGLIVLSSAALADVALAVRLFSILWNLNTPTIVECPSTSAPFSNSQRFLPSWGGSSFVVTSTYIEQSVKNEKKKASKGESYIICGFTQVPFDNSLIASYPFSGLVMFSIRRELVSTIIVLISLGGSRSRNSFFSHSIILSILTASVVKCSRTCFLQRYAFSSSISSLLIIMSSALVTNLAWLVQFGATVRLPAQSLLDQVLETLWTLLPRLNPGIDNTWIATEHETMNATIDWTSD